MLSRYFFVFVLASLAIAEAEDYSCTATCSGSNSAINGSTCEQKIDKLTAAFFTSDQSAAVNLSNQYTLIRKIESLAHMPPPSYIPGSCKDIKDHWSHSPSGYYTIATANGETTSVYCHMEELCNTKGPWTRIAYLNMSDPTHVCPPGFRLYSSNGVRACGRLSSSAGCTANIYFFLQVHV